MSKQKEQVLTFDDKDVFIAKVKEAYASLNVRPTRYCFYLDDGSACCPLTVLCCYIDKRTVKNISSNEVLSWAAKYFDTNIASMNKFVDAVDCRGIDDSSKEYKIGKYCSEVLFPKPIQKESETEC